MRRRLLAASCLGAAGFAAVTAWTLPAIAQPVTGLYVGVGGGAKFLDAQRIRGGSLTGPAMPTSRLLDYKTGWAALGSVGYGFGNGVRLEVEGDGMGSNRDFTRRGSALAGGSARETKTGAMANVFFDTDIGSPYVFPYFGAGAGWQSVNQTLSAPGTANGLRIDASNSAFAYQAIAGASFPIPWVVGLSATAEYRFMGLTAKRTFAGTTAGAPVSYRTSGDNNHMLLVGLRYAFNVTPPSVAGAPAPTPVSAPAPAPAPARSYLVFFDWDKFDLTDRARQIVAEAAQASKRVETTRIELAGHADRTGTAQYNLDLSRKRAAMVAGELVRLGVPANSITVNSYGDTKPLVPTGPNTREPQNRRVEIVLK